MRHDRPPLPHKPLRCLAPKLPTQQWLKDDFDMDVRVTPNFADFSCTFELDRPPLPVAEDPALAAPCLLQCRAKAPRRPGPAVALRTSAELPDPCTLSGDP